MESAASTELLLSALAPTPRETSTNLREPLASPKEASSKLETDSSSHKMHLSSSQQQFRNPSLVTDQAATPKTLHAQRTHSQEASWVSTRAASVPTLDSMRAETKRVTNLSFLPSLDLTTETHLKLQPKRQPKKQLLLRLLRLPFRHQLLLNNR